VDDNTPIYSVAIAASLTTYFDHSSAVRSATPSSLRSDRPYTVLVPRRTVRSSRRSGLDYGRCRPASLFWFAL